MDFVKKCNKVWGSSKRLHPEDSDSGRYGKLSKDKKKAQVAPHGCLWVYVGKERERFVIKIKIANHPLFKTFLDAAEKEYGYRNDGPLWLPCDVDFFCEALGEIESTDLEDDMGSVSCTFPIGHSHSHSHSHRHSPLSNYKSCAADYQLLG